MELLGSAFNKNPVFETVGIGDDVSVVDTDYTLIEQLDSNGDIISSITTSASVLTDAAQQSEINTWTMQSGVLKQITSEGSISLADDAEISLETGKAGFGHIMIGDNQEYAWFAFTSAGVVTLITNSTNVANTDSDTDLSIYDGGTAVNIKNRLGATLILRYSIKYSTL
jgi:hypothetical protein